MCPGDCPLCHDVPTAKNVFLFSSFYFALCTINFHLKEVPVSNVLLIYNQLRAAGVSRAGALGLMGNWKAESGLEPCRLQNDFSAGRIYSRSYTDDVTAGRITRAQFARPRTVRPGPEGLRPRPVDVFQLLHRPGEKAGTL